MFLSHVEGFQCQIENLLNTVGRMGDVFVIAVGSVMLLTPAFDAPSITAISGTIGQVSPSELLSFNGSPNSQSSLEQGLKRPEQSNCTIPRHCEQPDLQSGSLLGARSQYGDIRPYQNDRQAPPECSFRSRSANSLESILRLYFTYAIAAARGGMKKKFPQAPYAAVRLIRLRL